jgi:hypothetical protein
MTASGLPTASLKNLFITVGICSVFVILYGIMGIEPRPFVRVVVVMAPLIAAISWLRADARARRVALVHDMGLFLWLAWPVLLPWYAIRTRGRHGLPLALLVMFAILTPSLLNAAFEIGRAFSVS